MDNAKRAKILIQAMPYIKKFAGETIVVKYGGNAMINEKLKSAVMSDLVLMQLVGISVVLVHGGGPEINSMLDAVGKKSEFKDGMRVTDQETPIRRQSTSFRWYSRARSTRALFSTSNSTAARRLVCADSTADF